MSKLIDAFEIHKTVNTSMNLNDYEIFKDKNLLDDLRLKIIENIVDKEKTDTETNDFINKSIDEFALSAELTAGEREHLYNLIDNEINGFGPLTPLLEDKNITEIMVNGPSEVYIEIDGNLIKDDSVSFINNEHILRTIKRLISPMGRTIDTINPMVDSRLKDGSRINAVIPPLSVKGPVLTIRKFRGELDSIDELIRKGTLTPYMARFLEASVKARLNILVCGGTGSGKTTLLNVLSNFIDSSERIVTIEDAAELKLNQEHVVSLETRVMNNETKGEVNIRELVINSLRMRPDRIIVGEVRGKEAFDMLQAMNTGHDGSLTTVHANSAADALNRLETLVLMAGYDIPIKAVREYINNAIDLVVYIERLVDGRRKILSISEIVDLKDDFINTKDIFGFIKHGLTEKKEVDGEFVRYNYMPNTLEKLKSRGIEDIDYIFK